MQCLFNKQLTTGEGGMLNCHRPHSAHGGKTPYEVLKTKPGI